MRHFGTFLAIGLSLASAPSTWGWGPAGHHIVALIAEQRLSPQVRERVRSLLAGGQITMADASTCADALRSAERNPIRPDGEYCLKLASPTQGSGPWHYVDIPPDDTKHDLAPYCPKGACVTAKLESFAATLRDSTDESKRREALMYVIHFMGDIHQPLHCLERQCDQGGNRERVNFSMGNEARPDHTLHRVWDEDLLDKMMQDSQLSSEAATVKDLLAVVTEDQIQTWVKASITDIAWEGWGLSKDVYAGIPAYNYCDAKVRETPTPSSDLSPDYESKGAAIIRQQLLKAGFRLADLLERSLSTPPR